MKSKRVLIIIYAVLLVPLFPSLAEVPGIINYQRRVVVNGTNFAGAGQFKFALVDGSGTATFWSNDGTAAGEPGTAVSGSVAKGLYSVLLGQSPMMSISPTVFTNSDVRVLSATVHRPFFPWRRGWSGRQL